MLSSPGWITWPTSMGTKRRRGQLQMAFIKWALGPDWNAVVAVVDRRTPDSLKKLKVD